MFNSSIDTLGAANRPAGAHKIAAGHIALLQTNDMQEDAKPAQVSEEALVGAVKKLNEYVAPALQTIEFALDSESKRMIVKVVDTSTQKVLRQIPNEEVVAMSKTLDKLQGLVIRQTA